MTPIQPFYAVAIGFLGMHYVAGGTPKNSIMLATRFATYAEAEAVANTIEGSRVVQFRGI